MFRSLLSNKNVWFLLLALVILRLPFINRPLSKHHDFVTAVFLLNAESWAQAGGGKQFYYTPLLTYQGSANRILEKGAHVDAKGNHVYLSFGAGWYVLPYFLFKILFIPFTPFTVQLFSIIVGMVTAVFMYGLLLAVTHNPAHAFAGTLLYVLLPAALWYGGTAFVQTAMMLPLVLIILFLWHLFEKNTSGINLRNLSAFTIAGLLLCYIDWFGVFLCLMMALWAFLKSRNSKQYLVLSFIGLVVAVSAVFLILWQFSAYLGWLQVINYWKARFVDRSAGTSEFSLPVMFIMVLKNLATGYLPISILTAVVFLKINFVKISFKPQWPLWALAVVIPYNGLFFNWSAVHEFAWMAFGLIACIVVTVYIFPLFEKRGLIKLLTTTSIFSLAVYYTINLPGRKSWKGEAYNLHQKSGAIIRRYTNPQLPVFTNANNDKIVTFYSKRTLNAVSGFAEAVTLARQFGWRGGAWVELKDGKVEKIIRFSPPSGR
ncbi:MAG: hypothetical protein V4717_13250 [Bacteroidota bacterium]